MRALWIVVLVAGLMVGFSTLGRAGNFLSNADFKEGSQMWHGDAREVFLKPDGTEGSETDQGVTPVLRVALSPDQQRIVSQEFRVKDAASRLHASVQVYASVDFARSKRAGDYIADYPMPVSDFMMRLMPDYDQTTANLKRGAWVTVKATWTISMASDGYTIFFVAPPGVGVIYIKNPVVSP